jgi:hypothetical protein
MGFANEQDQNRKQDLQHDVFAEGEKFDAQRPHAELVVKSQHPGANIPGQTEKQQEINFPPRQVEEIGSNSGMIFGQKSAAQKRKNQQQNINAVLQIPFSFFSVLHLFNIG